MLGSVRPGPFPKICQAQYNGGALIKFAWFVPILFALFIFAQPANPARAFVPAQAPACTTSSPAGSDPSATVCVSEVLVKVDGASPQNSFVVSWGSTNSESGSVQLVGGAAFSDVRGDSFAGNTHYVQVNNLQPSTTYQFDIISGGTTFTNNNQHWSVTLGPALLDVPPNKITGRVKNADGTDAAEAIVYATIQRSSDSSISSLLSQVMTADNAGFFQIPLGDARTSDYSARFTFDRTKDKLIITAIGPGGFTSTTVLVNVALPPQPNPPNVTLTLGRGVVTVATATASPRPPTSTPTPITPSATPTLPPATATAFIATETAVAFTATPTKTPVPPTAVPPTSTQPPPTATELPTLVPAATLTNAAITISPADQETLVAGGTISSTADANPKITRVSPRVTNPNPPSSLFGGTGLSNLIFLLLAIGAFTGAMILGVAAIFLWKR